MEGHSGKTLDQQSILGSGRMLISGEPLLELLGAELSKLRCTGAAWCESKPEGTVSTSALLYHCYMDSYTCEWSHHSLGLSPCLDGISVPIFACPRMWEEFGFQFGSGAPAWKGGGTIEVLSVQSHGIPSAVEDLPSSQGNLCAKREKAPPTSHWLVDHWEPHHPIFRERRCCERFATATSLLRNPGFFQSCRACSPGIILRMKTSALEPELKWPHAEQTQRNNVGCKDLKVFNRKPLT